MHVVGNACLDTTFRLDRFPRPGETVNADGCAVGLGGKGANQALAACRAGADVVLWAAVGRDGDGVTPENAGDILAAVDGVIVASSLKHEGVWWNPVDPLRVKRLIAALDR